MSSKRRQPRLEGENPGVLIRLPLEHFLQGSEARTTDEAGLGADSKHLRLARASLLQGKEGETSEGSQRCLSKAVKLDLRGSRIREGLQKRNTRQQ